MSAVVLFAGAGGSSLGIAQATGQEPDLGVNHNFQALATHQRNMPTGRVLCEDVFQALPHRVWPTGRPLDLLWASPDCTHFSRAKGAAPVSAGRRSLADVVIDWAAHASPRLIFLENVPEFLGWGPLDADERPIKARAGEFFQAWLRRLQLLGYRVEWRVLRACDFAVPTIRKRLYLIARRDREPIVWPEPTHGPGLLPYVPAASCIDWSDLGRSIFTRSKPLADNTLRRIFQGLVKFVLEAPAPFLVNLTHGARLESLSEPMRTVTAAHRGEKALVVPWVQSTANGEKAGQAARTRALTEPLHTTYATGSPGALVVPWLAKNYGGPRAVCGSDLGRPLGTVTTTDHHALCVPWLSQLYGTARAGRALSDPMPSISAQGQHEALVAAYLVQYYGSGGQGSRPQDPLPAVVTKARHGLVTVTLQGQEWVVRDITFRMLKPDELKLANGFPADYELTGTIAQQIEQVGNAVCPPMARLLVEANLPRRRMAA